MLVDLRNPGVFSANLGILDVSSVTIGNSVFSNFGLYRKSVYSEKKAWKSELFGNLNFNLQYDVHVFSVIAHYGPTFKK